MSASLVTAAFCALTSVPTPSIDGQFLQVDITAADLARLLQRACSCPCRRSVRDVVMREQVLLVRVERVRVADAPARGSPA